MLRCGQNGVRIRSARGSYISVNSNTHILFVSHDPRDYLECLTHQL